MSDRNAAMLINSAGSNINPMSFTLSKMNISRNAGTALSSLEQPMLGSAAYLHLLLLLSNTELSNSELISHADS